MYLTQLEERIKRYADARWPDRDIKWKIRKLSEEFLELMEAFAEDSSEDILLESADMAIILADICAIRRASLNRVMHVKVDILEGRLKMVESHGRELLNEEIGG